MARKLSPTACVYRRSVGRSQHRHGVAHQLSWRWSGPAGRIFLTKRAVSALGMAVLDAVMGSVTTHAGGRRSSGRPQPRRLGLVGVLFSPPVNNARRWFAIGGLGVQPSELAKLVAIFFIAALLERRVHRVNELGHSLLPITVVVVGLVGLILLEPDFGTSMSLMAIAAVMVFAAGLNYTYILGAALCALPAIAFLVMGTAYRRQRVLTFLNPWEDPLGAGFQIIQSLIAVGTGGVWGRGLMNGVQKLFYLPGRIPISSMPSLPRNSGSLMPPSYWSVFASLRGGDCVSRCSRPTASDRFSRSASDDGGGASVLQHQRCSRTVFANQRYPLPFVSAGGSSLLISLVAWAFFSTSRSRRPKGMTNRADAMADRAPAQAGDCARRHDNHDGRSAKSPRRDRRRRHRRTPVSGNRRGTRMAGAHAGHPDLVCRDGRRDRSARRPARGLRARFDTKQRAEGQIDGGENAWSGPLAAQPPGRVANRVEAASAPGDRRRRLQLRAGRPGRGIAPSADDAAEQNAIPGLTNRLLAPFVRAAAVTFGMTRSLFGSKAFVSGSPVRPELFKAAELNSESRR